MELLARQSGERTQGKKKIRGEARRWLAVFAYLVLLGLTFATITDRRLLWFTVLVLLALLGLSLFRPLAEDVPAPGGRAADLGGEEEGGADSASASLPANQI